MAVKRGEIYFVDLNPVKGRETGGTNPRPVLVLSIDTINNSPLVVTVVIGTKGENITKDYPTNVRIPALACGLAKETVFLCFQIRSLVPSRFPANPAGRLSGKLLEKVENKVRYCLGL